jgi:NitT/TauT family transport system substrate-binding protein
MPISRDDFVRLTAIGLVASATKAARAQSSVKITVGTTNSNSDAPFFIAEAKSYFREQNLDVTLLPFDSAAKMVAPLGTGQLDVAAGAPSAGLYNAAERGIDLRIVADKGSAPKGYGYLPLMVRKALIDSGKVKSVRDLKGMKIAEVAPATASLCTLDAALRTGRLTYHDVQEVFLGFPDHFVAFTNGAIDGGITAEPIATRCVQAGVAVRFMRDDEFYPNQQIACVLYGGPFIKNKGDAANKFMVAYIKAARDYNDALKDGKLAGPNATEVIDILTKYTPIKNPAVYRAITPNGNDPNGRLNVDSLRKDLETFKAGGFVKGSITVERVVDESFAEAAVTALGPYHPKTA